MKKDFLQTSLLVQWLDFTLTLQQAGVLPLVRKLRSPHVCGMAKKKKKREFLQIIKKYKTILFSLLLIGKNEKSNKPLLVRVCRNCKSQYFYVYKLVELLQRTVNKSVYLMIHCIYLQCTDTVFYRYSIQKNKQIHTNFEQAKQAKRYACL